MWVKWWANHEFGDPGKAPENRKQNKLMLPGPQFPLLENEQGSQECLLMWGTHDFNLPSSITGVQGAGENTWGRGSNPGGVTHSQCLEIAPLPHLGQSQLNDF